MSEPRRTRRRAVIRAMNQAISHCSGLIDAYGHLHSPSDEKVKRDHVRDIAEYRIILEQLTGSRRTRLEQIIGDDSTIYLTLPEIKALMAKQGK